jgi:hypothetical protein
VAEVVEVIQVAVQEELEEQEEVVLDRVLLQMQLMELQTQVEVEEEVRLKILVVVEMVVKELLY